MTPPRSVLVAPDKFKGTLTAREAATAIRAGLQRTWPQAAIRTATLADGGEGFTAALVEATAGKLDAVETVDALGRPCLAAWGLLGDGATACVDLAAASGLAQIPAELRNPSATSTYGTGLVLRAIAARGLHNVIIGLGGSATNDGGIGAAAAFGFRFLDAQGNPVALTGGGLAAIARIEAPAQPIPLRIVIATDVDNPLCGPDGAARKYGAQKGATAAQIEELDHALRHFGTTAQRMGARDLASAPGAGAAGGCGFGFMALLGATRSSGFEVIRAHLRLDELIRRSDLVVTGEGAFDATTLAGKGPARLAELTRAIGRPVWGIFGRIDPGTPQELFDRAATLPPTSESALSTLTADQHRQRLELAASELARQAT